MLPSPLLVEDPRFYIFLTSYETQKILSNAVLDMDFLKKKNKTQINQNSYRWILLSLFFSLGCSEKQWGNLNLTTL